jgi:hypothetical protein
MGFERELDVLEEAIRRLMIEYDSFLFGATHKPPVESRKRVESMIRSLSNVEMDTAADRFRFNTLQSRLTSNLEKFARLQQEREEGPRHRVRGTMDTPPPASVQSGKDRPPRPGGDRDLYERYVEARRSRGEGAVAFERFVQTIDQERQRLASRTGGEVVFDVVTRDGKVKIVARPKGGSS